MIFINQIRQKIGVMFGNPETTSGGLALKFYSSRPPRRPQDRPASRTARRRSARGCKVKVVKNKVAPAVPRRPSST